MICWASMKTDNVKGSWVLVFELNLTTSTSQVYVTRVSNLKCNHPGAHRTAPQEMAHDENRMMIIGQLAMAKDARLLHAWKHHIEVRPAERPAGIA